jgi:hypothetical protein
VGLVAREHGKRPPCLSPAAIGLLVV